jgi:putative oxidoreductase
MKYIALVGRMLFSYIFITSGLHHFSQSSINYAASSGVPMAAVLVPISGALALIGGLCILLGLATRFGAWLIVLFLVPVTYFMHQFWNVADPQMQMMQQVNFVKNLALIGGALYIAYAGAGAISFDALFHHHKHKLHERRHHKPAFH